MDDVDTYGRMDFVLEGWNQREESMKAAIPRLNDAADLREENGRIVIEAVRQEHDLAQLLAGI